MSERNELAERGVLDHDVERGAKCYHGTERGCLSYRCGSNCSQRFDRMHPCPACLIAEIHELQDRLATHDANLLRDAKAEALREAADEFDVNWNRGHDMAVHPDSYLLRDRADAITSEPAS